MSAVPNPGGPPRGSAPYTQEYPDVASNGQSFLTVWADSRSGSETDVYAARVGSDGELLDVGGIPISRQPGNEVNAQVAWDGRNYLVVWQLHEAGSTIWGARVSPKGVVLDPSGILIATGDGNARWPDVAWAGTNYVVTWADQRSSQYIEQWGTRVTQSGTVLDPNGFRISPSGDQAYGGRLSCNGATCLLAWGFGPIFGVRVRADGTVLDPQSIVISPGRDEYRSSVAGDGTDWLVVWEDYRNWSSAYQDVYGARVSGSGVVLDPTGIRIDDDPWAQMTPDIVWEGTNYLAVWADGRRWGDVIFGARITSSGVVVDPDGIQIGWNNSWSQLQPVVAAGAKNALVPWTDRRLGGHAEDIFGARVTSSGGVLDPVGVEISLLGHGA